jgi:hypothetical protein
MPIRKKTGVSKRSAKFVLGRERFMKISAVEGITLSAAMKKRDAAFDKEGLSPAQRRRELIKIHRKG